MTVYDNRIWRCVRFYPSSHVNPLTAQPRAGMLCVIDCSRVIGGLRRDRYLCSRSNKSVKLCLFLDNLSYSSLDRPSQCVLVSVDVGGGFQFWTRCDSENRAAMVAQYKRALCI